GRWAHRLVSGAPAQVTPAALGTRRRREAPTGALDWRILPEDRHRSLGAQVLGHVVVRRDVLPGLVQLPDGLGGRLAARPGGHDPPGAVVPAVRVPGALVGVHSVLGQPPG